jgi:hypothetical protein
VRDYDGLAMLAGAGRINFQHDAIHGCLAALSAAFDQGMFHFILESDSTVLYGRFSLMTMISRLLAFSLEKQNFLFL